MAIQNSAARASVELCFSRDYRSTTLSVRNRDLFFWVAAAGRMVWASNLVLFAFEISRRRVDVILAIDS